MTDFDAWQKVLFDFTMKVKRPFTASEWKMLRYGFEMKKIMTHRPTEVRLAADAALLSDQMSEAAEQTKVTNFISPDGSLRMSVTVRGTSSAEAQVYFKLSDNESRPVAQGYIRIGETGGYTIPLDEKGRARISGMEYLKMLEQSLTISCVGTNGIERTMEID